MDYLEKRHDLSDHAGWVLKSGWKIDQSKNFTGQIKQVW